MSEWQPIKTLKPDSWVRVLGWVPIGRKGKGYVCILKNDDIQAFCNGTRSHFYNAEDTDNERKRIKPSHWMPLPDPPKEKE